jgi:hypothetical protein
MGKKTDKILDRLARTMFPPDSQGKAADDELKQIVEDQQRKDNGR